MNQPFLPTARIVGDAGGDADETILIPQPYARRSLHGAQANAVGAQHTVPSGGMSATAEQNRSGATAQGVSALGVDVALPDGASQSDPSISRPRRYAAPMIEVSSGLNPLVRAANPLLDLALPLRMLPACADLEALRTQLLQAIKRFEHEARSSGSDTEQLAAARYCLCTCLDEAIAGTPWGSGLWGSRSLLVTLHNEASGGERFFLILQRLAQDPVRHLDVLELIYVILSLGFEGRYRLIEGGRVQLESVRERLEQIIRAQRGAYEAALSPQWQPVRRARRPLSQIVPLWVAAALAGVVLVATHLALDVSLNRMSDRVFDALNGIRVTQPPSAPTLAAAKPVSPARLATFLAPEIAGNLVSVRESADRTVVTINGDGLFASGSATLAPAYEPLMQRIALALAAVPGKVVVTGHTDNQPLLSAQFPSNWHLSEARAQTVRALLAAQAGTPARFSAEGRGDAEPIASNDTAAGRAKNRRVEITLLAPGASS